LSEAPQVRQVCVLLREGRVLTDERSRLSSYRSEDTWDELGRRVRACGDPGAVLVAPQVQAGPDPSVVLSVFASRTDTAVDGTWTSLDDLAEEDPAVVASLRELVAQSTGLVEVPARRPEWFRMAWYDEADAWIDRELAARGRSRIGPTVPAKVWSLSAVLEVPSAPTPVWLKASCRHFHAEPALTRLVADILPEHAPPTIAADDERAWLLMEGVPGADEELTDFDPPHLGRTAARIAATLHLRSLDHLEAIEGVGVPVRGLTDTMHGFDEILVSSAELDQLTREEVATVRALRGDVHAVIEELAALGLPDTLVHGDLHPGNIARQGDALVFYDWSDAAVTHPLLDLAHLTRGMSDPERDAARAAYAEVWRAAYPDVDFGRGLELATQVNAIYQMVTFEQIYRAQEDASYWEMRGVVARSLRRLPERFPSSGG
jgi:aminoglycoside phosphotransferase (APT) family kinase protein